ncbi:MAG: NAD-dependent epimerase/dehydratase family protein [Alphaproteobacteria bacterium]|nr:NAD-dependent epimerase/dehydratase family protein [Alphaproteobacteria bacterium]
MQKIVLIGPDSYLATGADEYFFGFTVVKLYHYNWRENIEVLKSADWIINFSIHPDFANRDMGVQEIIDVQIAEEIKDFCAKFIFISSRKVYGTHNELIVHKETDDLKGFDFYSKNKIKTEKMLLKLLGDKLLILRCSNVIGPLIKKNGYKTFVGWLSERLEKNEILDIDLNENTIKDFISVNFLHKSIVGLVRSNANGIYNVSSGKGMTIKEFLLNYVNEDRLNFIGNKKEKIDQFILENQKLKRQLGDRLL